MTSRYFQPSVLSAVWSMDDVLNLRVIRLDANARIPTRAYPNDSGFDLYASESLVIEPGRTATIGTGIAVELPWATDGQVRPRSGLARDHQVTVLNSPGTIDEGYRGEIRVILINHGDTSFRGDSRDANSSAGRTAEIESRNSPSRFVHRDLSRNRRVRFNWVPFVKAHFSETLIDRRVDGKYRSDRSFRQSTMAARRACTCCLSRSVSTGSRDSSAAFDRISAD